MSRFRACPCGSGLNSEWQVDARGIELTRTCLKCHKEKMMRVIITDGGRKAAGFTGAARGDCVARSIAIVTGRPYREVYDRLAEGNLTQRASKYTGRKPKSASDGVNVRRKWCRDYMTELGFIWVPLMGIGTGCTVHLRASELPKGRLVVSCSKHWTAVIDGVIHDNHDPSRGGWRCVYGYYLLKTE